jgi:hypothetical protein
MLLNPIISDARPRFATIGDTRPDIAVANYGTNNICIFLGSDSEIFANRTTYFTGLDSHPISVVIGDFNNDNRLDIVVANHGSNSIDILFGYGNGSFQNAINYTLGYSSRPYSVAVGDFNQDNRTDIVVACSGTNNEQILLNMCYST